MKLLKLVRMTVVVSALGLGAGATRAQDGDQINQLNLQLEQMRANFEKVQREQREQIEALTKRLDEMTKQQTAEAERKKLEAQLATEMATNQPMPVTQSAPTALPSKPWSPSEPIRVGKGGTYMDIGLVADFAAGGSTASKIEGGTELGGHDPNQNGFTVQGVELNLQGAVDPYFRGNVNLSFQIDSSGESFEELEEAWMETVSLPWNLQVRAGQVLTEFGRINTQHPHAWAFVDDPLVNGRFLGPDGLRNPGARISWLTPTPFYSELFFTVQNSIGDTAYSFIKNHSTTEIVTLPGGGTATNEVNRSVNTIGDLLYTARYAASFDLTDSQTLVAGASSAFGPNETGNHNNTQIYGVDSYWKWKSPRAHGGFPFVSWQTEAMLRQYEATIAVMSSSGQGSASTEWLDDWGFYSQLAWGFTKGWVAALRGDYVSPLNHSSVSTIPISDLDRTERWRISPNLTWYPSEFSKIRLQYNFDDGVEYGVDHSVWLQFEFLLGAHAAHKF